MMKNTNKQERAALEIVANTYRHMYEELLSKVHGYYHDELLLRGDKTLNREYLQYFKIE
jgi:hypothetical protein